MSTTSNTLRGYQLLFVACLVNTGYKIVATDSARSLPITFYLTNLKPNYYKATVKLKGIRSWMECASTLLVKSNKLEAFSFQRGICYKHNVSECANLKTTASSLRNDGDIPIFMRSDVVTVLRNTSESKPTAQNLALGKVNGVAINHWSNYAHLLFHAQLFIIIFLKSLFHVIYDSLKFAKKQSVVGFQQTAGCGVSESPISYIVWGINYCYCRISIGNNMMVVTYLTKFD